MNTAEDLWHRLASSKKYREEYALSLLKRSVAFQIKTLRKKHCGSQAELAHRSQVTQGVVSRAEDQDYGNLTFNTVGRIAGGLDMAFVGQFVTFSQLVRFSGGLSEEQLREIPTFEEESARPTISLSDRAAMQRKRSTPSGGRRLGEYLKSSLSEQRGAQYGALGAVQPEARLEKQMEPDLRFGNLRRMPKKGSSSSTAEDTGAAHEQDGDIGRFYETA